tara:strand:- start:904 stop:1143 length:240 start_codon:yes stop_codon:yes gene_type:complete
LESAAAQKVSVGRREIPGSIGDVGRPSGDDGGQQEEVRAARQAEAEAEALLLVVVAVGMEAASARESGGTTAARGPLRC